MNVINVHGEKVKTLYTVSTKALKFYEFLHYFMQIWRTSCVFAFSSWSVGVCWSIQEYEEGGCSWPQNWKLLMSRELCVVSERNPVPTKHRFPQLHCTLLKSLVTKPQFVAQFYLSPVKKKKFYNYKSAYSLPCALLQTLLYISRKSHSLFW